MSICGSLCYVDDATQHYKHTQQEQEQEQEHGDDGKQAAVLRSLPTDIKTAPKTISIIRYK